MPRSQPPTLSEIRGLTLSTTEHTRPVVGIDIGGTKTAASVLTPDGEVGATAQLPTERGTEGVTKTVLQALDLLAQQSDCAVSDFGAIGIGLPGQVNQATGEVKHAHNLDMQSFALGHHLETLTGLSVRLENDVTAAALGTAFLLGIDGTLAYLNLGTGLAAGIVIDGKPLRGVGGLAGEIGHFALAPHQRLCPCGQRGCLETFASGSALIKYWPGGGEHPGWRLAAAAANDQPGAREALDLLIEGAVEAIRLLGITLAPDHVVIGGGLRMVGAPLIEGIRGRLTDLQNSSEFLVGFGLPHRLQVLPEGSPAATVGAALLVRT